MAFLLIKPLHKKAIYKSGSVSNLVDRCPGTCCLLVRVFVCLCLKTANIQFRALMSLSILCPSPCLAFFNIFRYHKRKISCSIIMTLYHKQYRCNLIMNGVDNKTNKQKCGPNIPVEKCLPVVVFRRHLGVMIRLNFYQSLSVKWRFLSKR